MAEIAIGIVIESLLRTVISVAAEKISLIVGKEKELTNLTEQLKMIKALLIDIHDKQIKTSVVQKWVEKLPSIILDAQIVFEELDYEVLRKKIENRKRDKARDLFSCSNPIAFNPTMTRKMKKVLQEVEDVFVEAGKFGIKPAELGSPSHALQSVRLSTDPYIEHSEFVGRRQDMERVIDMLNNASDFDVNRLLIEMLPPETNVKEMDNVQALVDELNRIKAAHILIDFSKGVKWKSLKDHMPPNLRTLHIKGKSIELFKDLCKQFPSLCVLIVDDSEATALPESIGDMKHLRVLDISLTSIRSLPKSFTKLYYLQTIRVDSLNEVPKGFGNLKNLRHICMNKPCALPGLGKLKNLRTIPEFKVGKFEGCQIEELEHLDKLRGKLKISNLHNVSSFESVAKSNLSKKCDLQTLELHWNIDCDDDINVMEGLEPHPNVKVLVISGYGSLEFPSWMRSRSDLSSSMRNLVKLQMSSLCKCNKLPSLGHLPCLAYLEIDTLPNLEFIGPEVYGLSNVDWATKKSTGKGSNGSYIITLFPALKVLKLLNMTNLISWFEATDFIPSKPASSSSSVQAKLCPCLEEIVLEGLPNLKAIPNLGSLQKLWVLDVSSCDNLRISWEHRNPQGDEFQQHQFFPWLHRLRICNSDYVSAPICNLIPSLAPVESLQIRCNPSFWPENLYQFINLKELQLGTRWKSDDLEIDDFPWPYPSISNAAAPNHFVSLTVLSLFGGGLPKVRSLPCQIQYLTSLTRLAIEEFTGLETLPEWLGDLECLVELGIVGCRNLKQLPEAFRRLTNLQHLIIGYCPVLGNRCTHGSGSEWPKIAHVPYVDICGNRETVSTEFCELFFSFSSYVYTLVDLILLSCVSVDDCSRIGLKVASELDVHMT
ncbi:OLC1v1004219C1 [Oldenlandia corymbosa var. corymbosa]|uniref:OLC1v1004219C1 n=1 Tax=Oldenlandia corymbosa var. corymbosa TaxID=529605 RepID=A0AAV1DBR1_OLDCO|nr:OLC1v1004219C1 [Oldenlandia corymbosa var. corymbosa]